MGGGGVGGFPQQGHPAPHKLIQGLPVKYCIDERGFCYLQQSQNKINNNDEQQQQKDS